MLSTRDITRIKEIARRYGVGRVLLFGSSVHDENDSRDIDLAVEGLAAPRFFAFYGELIFSLSKPVDFVDLSQNTRFTEMIRKEGRLLYG